MKAPEKLYIEDEFNPRHMIIGSMKRQNCTDVEYVLAGSDRKRVLKELREWVKKSGRQCTWCSTVLSIKLKEMEAK